jgi:hypothetical protein
MPINYPLRWTLQKTALKLDEIFVPQLLEIDTSISWSSLLKLDENFIKVFFLNPFLTLFMSKTVIAT